MHLDIDESSFRCELRSAIASTPAAATRRRCVELEGTKFLKSLRPGRWMKMRRRDTVNSILKHKSVVDKGVGACW